MSSPVSPAQFHRAPGVEDWRVVGDGACAHFHTESFADGARFVEAIGELARGTRSLPDADIRPEGVTLRLVTVSDDFWGITEEHVEVARDISALARTQGLTADPTSVQTVQVTVGEHVTADVMPFWKAVLGYEQVGDEDLIDPHRRGAPFWFQEVTKPPRPPQPDPRRRVRFPRSSRGSRGRGARRRRTAARRQQCPGVVDPGRPGGQRRRRGHPGGPGLTVLL